MFATEDTRTAALRVKHAPKVMVVTVNAKGHSCFATKIVRGRIVVMIVGNNVIGHKI